MRLLNATTLRLETVKPGSEPYAILSHRWTDDEVLYNDVENGTAHERRGYAKLRGCCTAALRENLKYVWIDTCCIDKSSSAELSEEINSMFRWYSMADVCYAYLHDATGEHDYLSSEWFDRGWTLQELIAPKKVDFHAKDWIKFGSRSELSEALSKKTGIAEAYLHGADLSRASIAERMSWAAKRVTTRPEDMAYCLLGIFNTHMSPIYGEGGEMAFIRLQRELLEKSSEHSFLAWGSPTAPGTLAVADPEAAGSLSGVLARSPASFAGCGNVETWDRVVTATTTPIIMQNVGIRVRLPVVQVGSRNLLLLRCHWRHDEWNVVAVPVEERSGRWYRTSLETTTYAEHKWPNTSFGWPNTSGERLLSQNPYVQSADIHYAIRSLPSWLRVAEVFPDDSWVEPRGRQTWIKCRGSAGLPTVRLVRLEDEAETGGVKFDYVLKLQLEDPPSRKATCQLGILPLDTPLIQADQLTAAFGGFGVAVTIPGESSTLAVELTTTLHHGKEAHVVDLFMDKTKRKREASRSRALMELPSNVERDEAEREFSLDCREERRRWTKRQETEVQCLTFPFLYLLFLLVFGVPIAMEAKAWVSVCLVGSFVITMLVVVVAAYMTRPEEPMQQRERLLVEGTETGYSTSV